MKSIAIFISGRGSNMKAILESCENGVLKDIAKCTLVFANKSTAAGIAYAQEKGIETAIIPSKGKKRVEFDQEVLNLLKNYSIDCIVLAGYMRILSPAFVEAYPKTIVNIHPADTLVHQGLDGYKWAFEQKLKQTKVTVHYVDEGLDTGEIIGQAVVDLENCSTLTEIEQAGLMVEHDFYSKAIASILK